MPHSTKRAHLSAWISADLKERMTARFGHLRSGVSGFVEEACEKAMDGPARRHFKRVAAVISKR